MIEEFIHYSRSKKVSDGAIKDYRLTLTKIERDCDQDLNNISQDILKEYVHKMKRTKLTLKTVKHRFYILLAYYKWAVASGYINVNPVEGIMGDIDMWYAVA